jgi:hypothetical protein
VGESVCSLGWEPRARTEKNQSTLASFRGMKSSFFIQTWAAVRVVGPVVVCSLTRAVSRH